jgi:HK97 family phage portal protein
MGLFDTLFNAFRKLKTSLMLPSGDIEISPDYVFRNAYFVAGVEAIIRGLQRLEVEVINEKSEKVKTFLDSINLNDLLRAIVYDLYTYGNAYVYIVKVANKITNLFSLPPAKVLIKTNNDGTALYVVEGKEINSDDILHFKRFIPNEADYYRTIRGDSVTKGVEDMLKLNYLINSSLAINFKRNNLPSIALINKQPLPASERERFIEDMEQKLMSNYSFLYLQGDTELKELIAKFPDWTLAVKDKIRDEVLAVLGVPRLLVGDTDSVNYANAKQQYQVFYTETIIPLARLLEDEFNNKIFNKQGLKLRFRTDAIEVLQQDIKDRAQAMMILWQMGYSVEELAEMFNLPKPKISESNKNEENTNEEKTNTNIVIKKTLDTMMLEDVKVKAFNFRKKSDKEFFNLITKLIAENIREFDSEMFNKVLSVLKGELKLADFEYELDKFFLNRNNERLLH